MWKGSMVPTKKERKETSSPSESTFCTVAETSVPGSSDPATQCSRQFTEGMCNTESAAPDRLCWLMTAHTKKPMRMTGGEIHIQR